jgi:hypothetical protein
MNTNTNVTRKSLLAALAAVGWSGPVSYVSGYSSQGKATLVGLLAAVQNGGDDQGWEYLAQHGSGKQGGPRTAAIGWEETIAANDLFRLMASV